MNIKTDNGVFDGKEFAIAFALLSIYVTIICFLLDLVYTFFADINRAVYIVTQAMSTRLYITES